MIRTFASKALCALWEDGTTRKLPPECVQKLQKLLLILDASNRMSDLEVFRKKYRIHTLKKPPYAGFLSFDITGNFRLIAVLNEGYFDNIDFVDTH